MSASFFYATRPACGHKRMVWCWDITNPKELKEHAKCVREAQKAGLVVSQAKDRAEAIDGFMSNGQCPHCEAAKAKVRR